MSAEWPVVRLGDYIDSSLGKMLDQKKNRGTEHPYLGNSDVRWGYFDLSDLSQMKFEDSENERYGIQKGDLIVCEGGEPGRCAIWNNEVSDMKIQKALHRIRPKSKLNNYYLYYWFLFSNNRGLLEPYFTGTTIKHLTGKALKNLEIRLPPLGVQEYVAKVLKSFDDKIQLNRQINQTLESMAQAIFQSWFVDFDPVKAKIAAREQWQILTDDERTEWLNELLDKQAYLKTCLAELTANGEQSASEILYLNIAAMTAISSRDETSLADMPTDEFAQLYKTASLFPERLVESELGEIPDGWRVQKLEDIIELAYGKALKKTDRIDGNFPVYGSGGVTGNNNESLVEGPGIIVGRKGTVGSLYWEDQSFFPIDTVFYIKTKPDITLIYVYYLLQILGLENMNTDAAVPGLNRNNVYRLEIIKPPESLIFKFSEIVISFRKEIFINQKEIQSLEAVRDNILPKLLSGELEIQSND